MKILWITIESILPANSGGRIGIFKRVIRSIACIRGGIMMISPLFDKEFINLLYKEKNR